MIFLPPLLYSSGGDALLARVSVANLRPILLLSTRACPVLTTCRLVGTVAHAVIPHLPWAAAFALGAIVAPTDAVAVRRPLFRSCPFPGGLSRSSLTRKPGQRRRLACVLQAGCPRGGDGGFLGRAGGLAVYLVQPGRELGLALPSAGPLWGCAAEWSRNPTVENTISLLSPFAAYLPAEALNVSGVLAVVAPGPLRGTAGAALCFRVHTPASGSDVGDD